MKNIYHYCILVLLLTTMLSCEKPEGVGGKACIKGTIWTEDWNTTFTLLQGDYASADVEVYIIYGNNTSYSQRIRTNYKGQFEFKFLREGFYQIYVYSKDKTLQSPSGSVAVVKDITISSKKQTVDVDRIVIYN